RPRRCASCATRAVRSSCARSSTSTDPRRGSQVRRRRPGQFDRPGVPRAPGRSSSGAAKLNAVAASATASRGADMAVGKVLPDGAPSAGTGDLPQMNTAKTLLALALAAGLSACSNTDQAQNSAQEAANSATEAQQAAQNAANTGDMAAAQSAQAAADAADAAADATSQIAGQVGGTGDDMTRREDLADAAEKSADAAEQAQDAAEEANAAADGRNNTDGQ